MKGIAIAHFFLRNCIKIGLAKKTLTDTAVEMIKADNKKVATQWYVHCIATIFSTL